jgi:hypothetical protein
MQDLLEHIDPQLLSDGKLEDAEGAMLSMPQVETPVTHHFSPGIYAREVFMPAGSWVIGHKHRQACLNILIKGKLSVMVDGHVVKLSAPHCFESRAGGRKMAIIHEDTIWMTVHPTDERDVEKLEDLLILKSGTFLEHQEEMRRLKEMGGCE